MKRIKKLSKYSDNLGAKELWGSDFVLIILYLRDKFMLMLKKVFIYLFIITGTFLLVNCAKMGSITGGPKDEDPPKVVGSTPLNYSTKFTGKRIDITFDEFITLNNVNQALVISPPLSGKPDVRLKGKTVQVILEGDLR